MLRRSPVLRAAPLSWAFYDFAYSAFSFLVAVRYVPTWIINDLDRPDWYVTMTQLAVALLVVVAMPLAGAVADEVGRRRPFLIAFTLVGAGASIVLGLLPVGGTVLPLLVAAAVAVAFGQLALAQFDPLLADVAPPEARGRVSGMAVALGFAGVIFSLVVVAQLVVGDGDKQRAFVPAGILYVVFALPALLLVRPRAHRGPAAPASVVVRRAFGQVVQSMRDVRRHRDAFQFLVGRFLYSDAIATLSAFLAVYMTRMGGFSESEKNLAVGSAVVAAAFGALATGRLVERFGPKRPLLAVLPAFAVAVSLSGAVGTHWTVWLASPVAGLALGCVWTADRVFMLHLAPPGQRGEFFGFFNLAGRVASALGPLVIWSGTVWLLADRTGWLTKFGASRVAIVGLGLTALLGWAVIRPVPDRDARAAGLARGRGAEGRTASVRSGR